MNAAHSCWPSLQEWTLSFVPFGLLLVAALLLPELVTPGGSAPNLSLLNEVVGVDDPASRPVPVGTPGLALYRAILTIWVSTLLLIPALCLYTLPSSGSCQANLARLFWTFSYLAYMVHFWYAGFVIFGGIAGILENMRPPIAITNLVLTAWWTLDVVLTWAVRSDGLVVRLEQILARTLIFLVFAVTEIFLRPTMIQYLGITLVVCVAISLLVRLSAGPTTEAPPSAAPV